MDAGVRDSALTVQGVLQAERLGQHLAASGIRYTHVFASDLQRAAKTAQALVSTQPKTNGDPELSVQQLPALREQDFGFYEGKPYYARQRDSGKSGKEQHRSQHQGDTGFQDVESKGSMITRTDAFVTEFIRPLILQDSPEQINVAAVVAHGIILSYVWRSILCMFAKQTVASAPGLAVGGGGSTSLEYLGGWSNTGYLELDIMICRANAEAEAKIENAGLPPVTQPGEASQAAETASNILPPTIRMMIRTVNGKEHLKGLKRARGVGSSQFDEGQKKIESFFKKTKVG
ncbi:MAG: hypothetical protein LQ338_004915 [Usnochroma carphineum]|nr:MAG: hypothetical protein LQ338_004915 [Usnochroma carphineum]